MRRLLHLDRDELGMALEAFVALALSRAALWALPYGTVKRYLAQRSGSGVAESREVAELVGRSIARASRRTPWRCTCLVQALAAVWMLSRRMSAARLRIGVARGDRAELQGHAWVESAGVLVTGGPVSHVARYSVLFPTKRT